MGSQALFISTPKSPYVSFGTANANRDGTGTIATLYTGGAAGSRVDDISVKATVTTTAGMVRFFKSQDNGTTWRLLKELPVQAITVSASVASWEGLLVDMGWILAAGTGGTTNLIGVSTHNAEVFHANVMRGGDY
jgi:hypothetical protein